MKNPKPRHHGRDHLPGGEDPIPNWPTGGVPSIATYYRKSTDVPLTVSPTSLANLSTKIPWLGYSLPSTGEVSAPDVNDYITFEKDCITIEFLQTQWDNAGYLKGATLGVQSRIVEADQYALGNAGDGTNPSGAAPNYGDSTSFVRPNIHQANDTMLAYCNQDDTVDRDMVSAYLVIYIWSIDGLGYDGTIPGWPM